MRHIIFLVAVTLAASNAFAQRFEAGGFAGTGGFSTGSGGNSYWVVGADACVRCNRKIAFYGEYSHFDAVSLPSIDRVDLGSVGARFQGRLDRRVRPFFDAGLSFGMQHESRNVQNPRDQSLVGVGFGGGATVNLGSRFYVRPAIRLHILSPGGSPNAAVAGGASVGLRF